MLLPRSCAAGVGASLVQLYGQTLCGNDLIGTGLLAPMTVDKTKNHIAPASLADQMLPPSQGSTVWKHSRSWQPATDSGAP